MLKRLGGIRTGAVALTVLIISSLGVAEAGAAPGARVQSSDALAGAGGAGTRRPFSKDRHWVRRSGESRSVVVVKFSEGTDVRERGGHLVSQSSGRIAALDDVLDRFPGTHVDRLFSGQSEEQHAASGREAVRSSGQPQADLNLYFRLQVGPGVSVVALVDALNTLDIVETSAPEPMPVAAPVTPSFVAFQGYRNAATSGGVDAAYAQGLAGGKGERASITDIEYSWNRSHEDLSKARVAGSALANGSPCDPFNNTDHGTAVLGELVADNNSFGVTGLAPGTTLHTVNAARLINGGCSVDLPNAINLAASDANSEPGDVILLEQQTTGPNYNNDPSGFGYVPVEYDQTGATWTAIKNATSRGRIVIEPAANGSQNLDDPVYNDGVGKNWFSYDSGAIMVGAGNAPGCTVWGTSIAREKLSFSNFGSRLDVQGWGDCVYSTGYGDLQAGGINTWYTSQFGGTSSASPIVTASAAILTSVYEARTGVPLTPASVRLLLRATGQPQANPGNGQIGPLPNLRSAIASLGPKVVDGGHVVAGTKLGAATVPVRQTWKVTGGNVARYDVWLKTDTGAYVQRALATPSSATAVFNLAPNHNYQFAVRAQNAAGFWGAWAYGPQFNLGKYEENYSATNPAFTGTWPRASWTAASGGFEKVSATAGNKAKFTFTGRSVAWIASRASNRGQADVYVDGAAPVRVNLYSATTTTAQLIAFKKSWATSGPHTIEIRVVGTAGHPKVDVDAFVRLQ